MPTWGWTPIFLGGYVWTCLNAMMWMMWCTMIFVAAYVPRSHVYFGKFMGMDGDMVDITGPKCSKSPKTCRSHGEVPLHVADPCHDRYLRRHWRKLQKTERMGKQVDMRKRKDWRQWGHAMTEPEKPEKMQKMQIWWQIWYGLMWVEMSWDLRVDLMEGALLLRETSSSQAACRLRTDLHSEITTDLRRLATSSATDLNVQCSAWCCLLRLVEKCRKKSCLKSAMSVISWVRMVDDFDDFDSQPDAGIALLVCSSEFFGENQTTSNTPFLCIMSNIHQTYINFFLVDTTNASIPFFITIHQKNIMSKKNTQTNISVSWSKFITKQKILVFPLVFPPGCFPISHGSTVRLPRNFPTKGDPAGGGAPGTSRSRHPAGAEILFVANWKDPAFLLH